MTLNDNAELRPGDRITVNVTGLQLVGDGNVEESIRNAFATSVFQIEQIAFPILGGHIGILGIMLESSGAGGGTLASGMNLTVQQFKEFFHQRLSTVSGLYFESITSIDLGDSTGQASQDYIKMAAYAVIGIALIFVVGYTVRAFK